MPRVILTVQSMSDMLLHYCVSGCAITSYSNATDFCSWYKITRTLICSELVAASKRFPGQSALIRHRKPLELNQQASRFRWGSVGEPVHLFSWWWVCLRVLRAEQSCPRWQFPDSSEKEALAPAQAWQLQVGMTLCRELLILFCNGVLLSSWERRE